MKFNALVNAIEQTQHHFQLLASKAVNVSLTIRNWLIGYYIVEYEQNGEDRAQYGDRLIRTIEKELETAGQKGMSFTNLNLYRQFYLVYPKLGAALPKVISNIGIIQTLSELSFVQNGGSIIQTASEQSAAFVIALSGDASNGEGADNVHGYSAEKLLQNLSFSHFVELLKLEDPLKRNFYEIECFKGPWSVRELKRQINSLYYERTGMSLKPGVLSEITQQKAEILSPQDVVKSVYAFEFLGLKAKDAVEESDLETALLDNLQDFMLEMGHGFCLEARQKKILIGDEYFFIDLVFYHRILKCHVLVELKVEDFNHHNIGQLNTYVNYYKAEVMQKNDLPPVGILLVTQKNNAQVEYATAGMNNKLFVSRYLLELPKKEDLEAFVKRELEKLHK